MDGDKCTRRSPLELRREFVGFRLENQVLVRVYELVVPLLLRDNLESDDSPASVATCVAEEESDLLPLAEGA